ncbi:MAG: hypothetical protein U0Q15_03645 [Kineosporiaceae bacterium]
MTDSAAPPRQHPSARRLAASAAGAVIALSALIAVPAAGALGTGAGALGTGAGALGTGAGALGTGAGPASSAPTTTPITSPPAAGTIDFEDGGTDGWTTTNRKLRLRVVHAAAQSGRRGLRIDGFDKLDASEASAATVTVPESRFTGTGDWRRISLSVRQAKAKVIPTPTCPGGTTPNNRPKLRIWVTTPETRQTTVVDLYGKSWRQVSFLVPASTSYTLGVSREFATLDSSVHLDSVELLRLEATPAAGRDGARAASTRAARPATHTEPPTTTWRPTGPSCTPRP